MKHAIFLNGSIGSGKTTLGRHLADALGGGFIDGDDHVGRDKPWYASSLQTSRRIVGETRRLLVVHSLVVVAYPLRCTSWIYYRRHLAVAGVQPHFVTLRAGYDAIVAPSRGRSFSRAEQERIREMLDQGYDARPFSDLVFDTDRGTFEETADGLTRDVARLIGRLERQEQGTRV